VDQIYLNRYDCKYLRDRGIRHGGKPLGKQPELSPQEKQKRKKEQNKRSEIEGKFGQAKSKYGLDDIKTRRADTSYACIGCILLAINVIKLAKTAFLSFFMACTTLYECLHQIRSKVDVTFDLLVLKIRHQNRAGLGRVLIERLSF